MVSHGFISAPGAPDDRANGLSAGDSDDPLSSDESSSIDFEGGDFGIPTGSSTNEERIVAINDFAESVAALREAVLRRDILLALSFLPGNVPKSTRDSRVLAVYIAIERECRTRAKQMPSSYDPHKVTWSQVDYRGHMILGPIKDTDMFTLEEIYGTI